MKPICAAQYASIAVSPTNASMAAFMRLLKSWNSGRMTRSMTSTSVEPMLALSSQSEPQTMATSVAAAIADGPEGDPQNTPPVRRPCRRA